MKRASIRVQEPTPELIEKIRRARVAISQQKPRYLKCPYCQHIPLQNMINTLYSKDISRKVSTALKAQMESGEFKKRNLPYGYRWDEEHSNMVFDEKTAPIVRKIFQWKIEGLSLPAIADRLDAMNAPNPEFQKYQVGVRTGNATAKKIWNKSSLTTILDNPHYVGDTVLGRTLNAIYKGVKNQHIDREEWIVFPNTHEAIISREDFQKVRELRDAAARTRVEKMERTEEIRATLINLFEDKIVCADCGRKLYFHRKRVDKRKDGAWYAFYECSSSVKRGNLCTPHYMRQDIVPHIGDVKLTALTTLQIQKFYNETKAHGRVQRYKNMDDLSLSNKTIRGLHTMLRQCLEQAVTERLIPYNPANGCRLPKKEKKKMQIIPPEKIRDYLKAAEEWGVLPMFYLELSTGLRRGELVALLWSDLNLQTKTLTVSKSVSRGKGELVVTEPKTENSVREIYLSDEAIRLLVEDRKNHPFSPYMFPSPKTGGMYGPDCVGRIHKKLLEKAGIEEHVRFHDLRHTFSTLAIQSGIDPKTVAEILGHASAEFSLDVYTHVTTGMKKEAAQKISGFMASVG